MVFSSPIFLFLFLPLVLAYFIVPGRQLRNIWLLVFSIIFYAWGEVVFVFLMLGSALMNHFLGLWVDKESVPSRRKWAVGVAVALNIGTLVFFKYANFVVSNLNELLALVQISPLKMDPVRLPIGISFFTFHALSYVVDVYRRKWSAAKNPADVALYIFFFPQLIAGPILRWSAIAPQIAERTETAAKFAEGIRRFAGGLGKKMIIANALAVPADQIFALPTTQLTPGLSWLGTACYALQVYFDFSGYSDMAVGLGKMFGFEFLENFNFPFIAQSVKEFWRRWHISLSSWFRDYLYIPLGGNRCSEARNYLNLVIVFFLCGLWHGASWTFVVWGLYHGMFLVLERTRFGDAVDAMPRPARHIYLQVVLMISWVLFRADTFPQAMAFLRNMAFMGGLSSSGQPIARYLTHQVICTLILGAIFSTPAFGWARGMLVRIPERIPDRFRPSTLALGALVDMALVIFVIFVSASWLAGGTYNPFIYFRF